jgi:hypothetical protein
MFGEMKKATREPPFGVLQAIELGTVAETIDNVREDVTNCGTENRQNDDNDNSNQDEDEGVFDQTLTFFILRAIQHDNTPVKI